MRKSIAPITVTLWIVTRQVIRMDKKHVIWIYHSDMAQARHMLSLKLITLPEMLSIDEYLAKKYILTSGDLLRDADLLTLAFRSNIPYCSIDG